MQSVPKLLITDVPVLVLSDVSRALHDALRWYGRDPHTREDRIKRDEALIHLHQASWHVDNALHGPAAMPELIDVRLRKAA